MPKTRVGAVPKRPDGDGVQVVPLEYAGKWVAWSADGRRIVAVGDTFQACERAAVSGGFPADQVAIGKIPVRRRRLAGPGE